jgi:hypothetical protein
MARVSIATVDKAETVTPSDGTGDRTTLALFNRPKDPIHLYIHRLGANATLHVRGDPSDVSLFVWEGSVRAGGSTLKPRSSAVVEYGASLIVEAEGEGAVLLAFNLRLRDATERAGHHVHILPSELVPRTESLGGTPGVGGALHADSQCPTCKVWLHENSYAMADKETALHSHSEDEVIFVHSGTIRLGNRLYGPGTALAIAANTKYGFFSGPDGLGFVNFRGTSPTFTSGDGKTVLDEAALWRQMLGTPSYLQLSDANSV